MRSVLDAAMRGKGLYYSCPNPPTGCGALYVNAELAETWLRAQVCARIETVGMPSEPDCIVDVPTRLAELANAYYVQRLLTRDEFLTVRAELESLPQPPSRNIGKVIERIAASDDAEARLAKYGIEIQRDVFRRYVVAVEVRPTKRGRFDPARLKIAWRDAVAATAASTR